MVGPPGRHLTVDNFLPDRGKNEGRRDQLARELVIQGLSKSAARDEVEQSIDRLLLCRLGG